MNTSQELKSPATAAPKEGILKGKGPLLVIVFSALLVIISVLALIGYFFFLPKDSGSSRPLVLIHSPGNGAELEIGTITLIHATARDDDGITRMEFWVDGVLEEVETSSLEDGLTPFPMLVSWEPDRAGDFTLTFRGFNSNGTRASSSIIVEGVFGSDRDGDGIDNALDACQDTYGAGEDGCPIPGDADGDGVLDPDDLCPEEPGEVDDLGCPDRDGDGVPDHLDADPDEPGPAELDGAPDRDADGVPDDEDLRPDDPGDPGAGGAPESGVGDRDGDGAADDVDPCPDEAGAPEDGYCPAPEDDPAPEDEDPVFDGPEGDAGVILLEVEAYSFRVDREYEEVWCYLQLEDLPMEQYEFNPDGELEWNIHEVLAGVNSIHLPIPETQDLDVHLNCLGIGQDGLLHNIGEYEAAHAPSEWDGRELIGSGYGPEDAVFVARYRICTPDCDETEIQPPILDPITLGPRGEGPYQVRWHWDGDEEWLTGFIMTVNSNLVDSGVDINPDRRSMDLGDFVPECGEVLEFQVNAYGSHPGDDVIQRSAPSNIRVWDGRTCPRTVSVSFLTLDPSGRSGRDGPIYGSFIANDQRLEADFREGRSSFDGTDDPEWNLNPGHLLDIPYMFAEIEREAASCIGLGSGCTSNYAPSSNAIEVELGARETLTFGASIWTEDDGRVFEGFESIPAGEIVPGIYYVNDNGIRLEVAIDVLVGPEAGGVDNLPDLVVTDVTQEETSGQLRIHVFNNAADLISEDVKVAIVRLSTGEELYLHTWENVTMPSGSLSIFQAESIVEEPYDLRILIDPVDIVEGGGIDETNELNNIYETPVRLRVHINAFRVGGGPCESFLDLSQSAEFTFRTWLNHRSPDGEITHIGTRNHPWTGTLDYYWGESPDLHIGEWDLHDNESFTFEFEMPADHSLIVHADGTEVDPGTTTDDYAGFISESYGPDVNYGAREAEYVQSSEGWHECHDGTPLGWDTNNFRMWWTITRIH
ncbi:MAG: Ig-like domain-containing protein [Anaerolineales bacterium]|nr:Ig-like domain-containing protein [Anaerolineales bacterium]